MDSTRKARQDARIRGPATRRIHVEPLKIQAPLEGRKPKLLQSALIDDQELATLSRFRRTSSLSFKPAEPAESTKPTKATPTKPTKATPTKAKQTKTKSVKAKPTKAKTTVPPEPILPIKKPLRKLPLKIKGSLKNTFMPHSPLNIPNKRSIIANPFSDDSDDDIPTQTEQRPITRTYKSRNHRSTIEIDRGDSDGIDDEIDGTDGTDGANSNNVPIVAKKLPLKSSLRTKATVLTVKPKKSGSSNNNSNSNNNSGTTGVLQRPHFPVKETTQDDNDDDANNTRRRKLRLRDIPRPDFNEEEYNTYILDSDDDYLDVKTQTQSQSQSQNDDQLKSKQSTRTKKSTRGVDDKEKEISRRKRVVSKVDSVISVPRSSKIQKIDNHQPISLTKSKLLEALKLLEVDLERLEDNNNIGGKKPTTKVTTLDVLLHLVKNFNPEEYGFETSVTLDESSVNDSMKMHLLYHLGTLLDYQSSIYNLLDEVKAVEREKAAVREQLFQLRKDHRDLGNEMNDVRRNLLIERANFERLQGLDKAIKVAKEGVEGGDGQNDPAKDRKEKESQLDLHHLVQNGLIDVDSVVNPHHGIYQKLLLVNEKLVELQQKD